jgi:hypothetical protein
MVDGADSPPGFWLRNSAVPSGAKVSEVTLVGRLNLATSRWVRVG